MDATKQLLQNAQMQARNFYAKVFSEESTFILSVWIIIFAVVFLLSVWVLNKTTLNDRNCKTMDSIYTENALLKSLDTTESDYNYKLRDYYIKTAYNCCSAGEFKNDFVNLCALRNCIKAGARCLDFAVYSVNNSPVIAVSSLTDFSTKESYNYISFGDALETIANNAFSAAECPCHDDPLLLHMRIMSKNKKIYADMTKDITDKLNKYLLDSKYSYEFNGKNIGGGQDAPSLDKLKKKVIIIVDYSNKTYQDTPLYEFVNIASNSSYMRALHYHDVKYTSNMTELVDFNKTGMTICLPDLTSGNKNIDASIAEGYGCQMIAMSFQNFDNNMEYVTEFYNSKESAFSLKPENLRHIDETVAPTKTANPNTAMSHNVELTVGMDPMLKNYVEATTGGKIPGVQSGT